MKIKFLQDYIGRETAMKQYKQGDELELDHRPALDLIGFGVAEEVIKQEAYKGSPITAMNEMENWKPDNVGPRSKRKIKGDE